MNKRGNGYQTSDIMNPSGALDYEEVVQREGDHQSLIQQEDMPLRRHIVRMPKRSKTDNLLRYGDGNSGCGIYPCEDIDHAATVALREGQRDMKARRSMD